MVVLFYVVFFAESMGRAEIASGYKYNLTFFREIRRYARYLGQFDTLGRIAFLNIIGNVLAFVPFGILVPWLSDGRVKFIGMLVYGFALSLTIETVQLVCKVGTFDVDDLFLNVVGAVAGYITVSPPNRAMSGMITNHATVPPANR